MKKSTHIILVSLLVLLLGCETKKEEGQWIQLFNGKDLEGWDLKIKGYPVNENYRNTFRVENGNLKVTYQEYDSFRNEFGHIYYEKPFSNYRLRIEYRFSEDRLPGCPDWANRNNGAMLHSQSAFDQQLNQNFPVSIEFQFLGEVDGLQRTNGNLASPGTHVLYGDSLYTPHMLYCNYPSPPVDSWVSVEAIVYGDSIIHHVVEGDTVLTYRNPVIGGWEDGSDSNSPEDKSWLIQNKGVPLKSGHIALQAEGAGIEFRKIELLEME